MKPGIFDNIDINDYHADKDWLSSTPLREAGKSLRHYWYYMQKEEEKKSHFDFGNAFELALLDQKGFEKKVAIKDDAEIIQKITTERPKIIGHTSTKEYRTWKDEFFADNEEKYIIDKTGAESYETIEVMLDSCFRDRVIQSMIKNIEYQYSLMWIDETTGLKLKTRPDICKINKNVIVDVKTARDGSPDGFARSIRDYKLHIQAIMQIDGVLSTGLMPSVDGYFWLVVEKEPPYNATLYEFTEWQQEESKDEYHFLLKQVKEAKEKNLWTGYSGFADNKYGILPAPIKPWTFKNYSYD